jgi:hypothetical protein
MLGIKDHKPKTLLGVKKSLHTVALGVKRYLKSGEPKHPLHKSEDGIIYNYSNSNDAHREPNTYTKFTPKKHIVDIQNSKIEKRKKEHKKEDSDKKFI